MNSTTSSRKWYPVLYGALFFYSLSSVMTKLSSRFAVFSWPFLLSYGASLAILVVYAVVWQQVLKHFSLSTAYANKPVATLLSMIWGVVLFDEPLTWNMVLGAAILLCGIRMVVSCDA